MPKCLVIILLVGCSSILIAQSSAEYNSADTVLIFPEIELVESYYIQEARRDSGEFLQGYNGVEDLWRKLGVQVLNYSPGQLQSLQYNGLPASHQELYWNGVDISNTFLGVNDLSRQVGWRNSQLRIDPSPSGIPSGERFQLSRDAHADDYLTVQIGSYGRYGAQISGNSQIGSHRLILSGDIRRAKNDFTVRTASRTYRQPNADFIRYGGYVGHRWVSGRHRMAGDIQYTHLDRLISPPMDVAALDTRQEDRVVLGSYRYTYQADRWYYRLTSGYYSDQIDYFQTLPSIDSRTRSQSYSLQQDASYNLSSELRIHAMIYSRLIDIASNQYSSDQYLWRNRYLLRGDYTISHRWTISAKALLYDYSDHPDLPVSWSLLAGTLTKGMLVRYDRVYRLPTLNDRYWAIGGNPELKAEQGHKINLQYRGALNLGSMNSSFQIGGHYQWIGDWIQWIPMGAIWSPVNVKRVRNRGVKAHIETDISFREIHCSIGFMGAYTDIIQTESEIDQDPSIGKSLLYVPCWSGRLHVSAQKDGYGVTLRSDYAARRYTARDESAWLPGYMRWDCDLSYEASRWQAVLTIENITHLNYQLIRNRPMPGRAISLSLNYEL